jgi:tetrahydromethanopterin S-methyltransferase subunit G
VTNYQYWALGFAIFQFLFNTAIAISVWWKNRDKINSTRFKEVEDRLTKIESKVQSMPVCGNHSRMEDTDRHINDSLAQMGNLLAKIDGRLDGINRMVDLLTQNELTGGKQQ